MGWREYYRIDEAKFRENYERLENWGDLAPYKLLIDSEEHYGAGKLSDIGTNWYFSPKIQHYVGRTRITVEYYLYVGSGATGKASIGIVFYKNDVTSKDSAGNDFHGAQHTVSTAPSADSYEKHTFVVEQDNNKITWYVDDVKLGEEQLEASLVSFKLAVKVDEASGGYVGIVITSVSAEYYDVWEDWANQILSVMQWMIPLMFGIMLITMIISVLRSREKG